VLLVGTSHETTTDAAGVYSFQVPAGNYPGGVRFEKADFETAAETGTITVLNGSTYGVPTRTVAATHNSLAGSIDLVGEDSDAGITVTIVGLTGFSMTTGDDGLWSFDHVPLGTYTVRFTRSLTPDVTTTVTVGASEPIVVPRLDMIPNASGLKGYIRLTGMSDHAGIRVTVTSEGQPDSVEPPTPRATSRSATSSAPASTPSPPAKPGGTAGAPP
jgi:hypothetical protein